MIAAGLVQQANAQPGANQNDEDRMFRGLDANQDGRLTLDEGGPDSQQMVRRLLEMAGKKDGDSINRQEFARLADQHRRGTMPQGKSNSGRSKSKSAKTKTSTSGNSVRDEDKKSTARSTGGSRSKNGGRSSGSSAAGLDGLWRGWVVDGRGENANAGHMEIELRIAGQHIVGREVGGRRSGSESLGEGDYVMTASGNSGELDVSGTAGPTQGKEYPGIFELDGDTLKWCVNNRGRGRPRSMETGNGNYLMILRRQN